MRVLILWTYQTSFIEASILELEKRGFEVEIYYLEPNDKYPPFSIENSRIRRYFMHEVKNRIKAPEKKWDFVFCIGWHIRPYLIFLIKNRKLKRIMYMDNQYVHTIKQKLFTRIGKIFVELCYDAAFVPGDRQLNYAKMIGFSSQKVQVGGVSYDSSVYSLKTNTIRSEGNFVFVGRIAQEKGLEELISAHRLYCEVSKRQVKLTLIGPKDDLEIETSEYLEYIGYRYPSEVVEYLSKARFFVFPSHREAWGVALVEAAAVGCALISSRNVGATDHLLTPTNGILIGDVNVESILNALLESDNWTEEDLAKASKVSASLAQLYKPENWCDSLLKCLSMASYS